VLEACAQAVADGGFGLYTQLEEVGCRVAGAHFYGPYFGPGAHGCHPASPLRPPTRPEFEAYLAFGGMPEGGAIAIATVAPELPGAETFASAARQRGIRLHAGHSNATLAQVETSLEWGVRHIDHLFCAMSDKTKLREA
jgi:N-acetylglucosamine-6-phosphate deacetylase